MFGFYLVKMCLIFYFIFYCELIRKKKGFFGKKTDMEWGPALVIFVIGIEKIGVLHFSRVRFILS